MNKIILCEGQTDAILLSYAKDEKTWRLSDRVKLPLKGLHPVHILSSKAMCV